MLPSARPMLPLPASPPRLNVAIVPLLLLKSKLLLVLTVTVLFCRALALFNESEPAEIVVPPVKVLLPSRASECPCPICVRLPLPLIDAAKVAAVASG